MTNTPESDTMNILDIAKEQGANINEWASFHDEPVPETTATFTEAQLLATFNAWSAQQSSHEDNFFHWLDARCLGQIITEQLLRDEYEKMVANRLKMTPEIQIELKDKPL